MRSSLPKPPTSVDSIVIDQLSLPKSNTCILHTNRPYLYNYWTLNDRYLRVKNEKLAKRQQRSCRIAFYSLWLLILSSVICIVIHRFTDKCSRTSNEKELVVECWRYWFLSIAICLILLACSGLIYGTCRYFRSQPRALLCKERELPLRKNNYSLPIITASYSTSLIDDSFIIPNRQIQNENDEYLDAIDQSSRRRIPPFYYDELPSTSNRIRISKSLDTNKDRNISVVPLTSLQPIGSAITTAHSNECNTHLSTRTCVCEVDVWEKQQELSAFY